MPNSQQSSASKKLTKFFEAIADGINDVVGSPFWFVFSVSIVVIWFFSGFFIGFNEIWHLLINTTTTIMTFLMMSLLHASQSKWEQKMEKLQSKEKTEITHIKQKTEEIATASGVPENNSKAKNSKSKKETTNTLI